MLDLYLWTTPNGRKPLILLEELGEPYTAQWIPLDGTQHQPSFTAINPNGKIPALVDQSEDPAVTVIESGAILIYLAEKFGRFLPESGSARAEAIGWLMWQMGGIGPMCGQLFHFKHSAPEPIEYALTRYRNEVRRLFGVMNHRLGEVAYLGGEMYGIADMAVFPWVFNPAWYDLDPTAFPHVQRWIETIAERPAVMKAMAMKPD